MNEPEFIRGNQKNYIRVSCDVLVTEGYEYQMCTNNELGCLLKFHKRTQNGENYLYYEVSGLQSLDILLQTQKLKRTLVLTIARSIVKLCREFSEYVLDIEKIIWKPQYIMMQGNGEALRFAYIFSQKGHEKNGQAGLEEFLEYCIEYLDYQDELLTEQIFRVYEALLEQKNNFILIQEMERLLETLSETEGKNRNVTESVQEDTTLGDPFNVDDSESEIVTVQKKSKVFQKERRHLKLGLSILLVVDVLLLLVWKPVTILKIFFSVAVGSVLLWLNIYVRRQDFQKQKMVQQEQEESVYMEEYEDLTRRYDGDRGDTCMITLEGTGGVLYNLQNCEPQYIYVSDVRKIIGKDPERVQIQLTQEGVSRIHAMIYKEDSDCLIEDLNSTNGTWVNEKCLKPREAYVLKEGDKVRFAGMEYIFR